jgi:hypothetical protein
MPVDERSKHVLFAEGALSMAEHGQITGNLAADASLLAETLPGWVRDRRGTAQGSCSNRHILTTRFVVPASAQTAQQVLVHIDEYHAPLGWIFRLPLGAPQGTDAGTATAEVHRAALPNSSHRNARHVLGQHHGDALRGDALLMQAPPRGILRAEEPRARHAPMCQGG